MSLHSPLTLTPSCDDDECEPCPTPPPRRSAIVERIAIEVAVVAAGLLLPKLIRRVERWFRDATKPPAPPAKPTRKRAAKS